MKAEYKRTNYPSDLTDKQWEKIAEFFPSGNKSKHHKRNLVEATMYVVKTGCQWRALPHDYPHHIQQFIIFTVVRRRKEHGKKLCSFL